MAKDKTQKKKERERRVAKEKLAAIQQRRDLEKTATEGKKAGAKPNKLASAAQQVPKVDHQVANARHTFARRRSVG
jgi:hypothetical protein